jgi:hypothetical protein
MSAWNDEARWQSQILGCLAELSDLEYQSRAWRGEIPGELHSFEECVEMLFGDTQLGVSLGEGEVFSAEIDRELRTLMTLVEKVNPRRPVGEVLADPVLDESRSIAAKAHALIVNRSGRDLA